MRETDGSKEQDHVGLCGRSSVSCCHFLPIEKSTEPATANRKTFLLWYILLFTTVHFFLFPARISSYFIIFCRDILLNTKLNLAITQS